jgi:hypothetical protein
MQLIIPTIAAITIIRGSDLANNAAVAAGPVSNDTTMIAPTDSNAVTVERETIPIKR